MAYKDKEGEVYPLLTTDWLGCPTYRQKPVAKKIRGEDDIEPVIEDDDEVFDIIDQKKKRNVNLVWIDVALMALDYLQVYLYIIEPQHEISNNVVCATSKASDQPVHVRSLIRAFASRLNIL